MTDTSAAAHSGADLARQALAAYKVGRRPGIGPVKPARQPHRRRSDGCDPQTFATVLERLGTEQGWTAGVRGADIVARFTELCPQFDGRVIAVAWHAETGRLDLRPGSPAYATNLRLLGRQLCQQINTKLGQETVRAIGILPVASLGPAPSLAEPVRPEAAATPAPTRTRETASDGYRRALAAHHEHRGQPVNLTEFADRVAAARARQDAALTARRLPAEEHAEYLAQLELQQREPVTGIEASIQAARRYARTSRPVGAQEPRQVFGAA
ncbi:DciA family protein [Streptomyces sp. NPDC058700]|uniref:DciA family protein n=1 Tax=Streptomyces sp. NPDC058700 TaxID=3346607 RepID=UPI003664126F